MKILIILSSTVAYIFAETLYFIPDYYDDPNKKEVYTYRGYMQDIEPNYQDSMSKRKDIDGCFETEAGCGDIVIQKRAVDGVCISGCQ